MVLPVIAPLTLTLSPEGRGDRICVDLELRFPVEHRLAPLACLRSPGQGRGAGGEGRALPKSTGLLNNTTGKPRPTTAQRRRMIRMVINTGMQHQRMAI